MKSSHLTILLATLSLSISPVATLSAMAQQDTKSGGQAQSDSQSMDTGSQTNSGKTGVDCTSDASGSCSQGKGQSSQQKAGKGSDTQKNVEQPSTNSSTSGTEPGKSSTETKPGSRDAGADTTNKQKPTAKSGMTDNSGTGTTGTKSGIQNAKPAEGTSGGASVQSGDATKQSTDQNATTTNKSSSETNVNNTATNNQTTAKTNVNISVEQQTEIRTAVKEVHIAPVKDLDFTVSVGVKIPKKVRLETLPPRIVKIVPQYEGYRYFILADGRIVIVDPEALTIVFIIDA